MREEEGHGVAFVKALEWAGESVSGGDGVATDLCVVALVYLVKERWDGRELY